RITKTVTDYTQNGGSDVQRTRTWVWNQTGDSPLLVHETQRSTDGHRTWDISFGRTNRTFREYQGDAETAFTQTAPDGSYTYSYFVSGGTPSYTTRLDANNGQLSQVSYGYDNF